MANFTCLAAARHEVLRRAGWNVETQGLQRAPRVRVIAGGEVHVSAVGALRYLGFGTDEIELIPVDGQGRMRADALEAALADGATAADHRLRAGRQRQHRRQRSDRRDRASWRTHAARGSTSTARSACGPPPFPSCARRSNGIETADSWATDAHKWLNVPYDSGLAIVADAAPHRAAMSMKASYLQRGDDEERVGMDWAPESSRRARVLPLYALFRVARPRRHRGDRPPQLRARAPHGRSAVDANPASRSSTTSS